MKKVIKVFLIVAVILIMGACTKKVDQAKEPSQNQLNITIVLKEDNQEFAKKELTVNEKESLQTVMDQNFKLEMDKDFISGIDGHKQNAQENKYWLYDVNGKQPDVAAVAYFLKDGDVVTWSLNKLD
ncbi:DUF4430 domain-containing protein [Erwinia sp. CPCC 100877]|nr:DUF4430 domain-containing protein [Erwinia sp. CPCC 100877]